MEIRIRFRGIMLFVTEGAAIREVALPATETGQEKKPKHLDGSGKRRHHRGLIHKSAGSGKEQPYPLKAKSITWSQGTYRAPSTALTNLADLRRPKASPFGDLRYTPKTGTTRLDLTFPCPPVRVSAEFLGEVRFSYYRDGPVFAQGLELGFDKEFDLRPTGQEKPISMKDGDCLYVYNADKGGPSVDDLNKLAEPGLDFMEDDDFKWLYDILTPYNGTMGNWAGGFLPAPKGMISSQSIGIPSVSTCFPGWI